MQTMEKTLKRKFLNLPSLERRKFPRHFLNAVHCEISFSGTAVNSILNQEASLTTFFEKEGFASHKKFVQNEVRMENAKDKDHRVISHRETPLGFVFSSNKPKIDVQVLDTKIVISDFNYEGFDKFQATFRRICEGISKIIPRQEVKKIGFRKINSVIINPVNSYQDACAIFNPALFAIIRSGLINEGSLKNHEEVTFIEEDSLRFILRCKIKQIQENTCESTLDFDFIDVSSTSLNDVFDKKLPELNNYHFNMFMWAASDELIRLMEAQ